MNDAAKLDAAPTRDVPRSAAIFGGSGGIGAALCGALARRGCETIYAGSRSGTGPDSPAIHRFTFDLTDEASIAAAAHMMKDAAPDLVIAATGVLSIACTGAALLIYFRLVRTLGSMGVASQSYLRAGIGVLLGIIFLGETFTLPMALGLGTAIMGVALINWPSRPCGNA